MKYLFVQERESQAWICMGEMPWEKVTKKKYEQKRWIYPRPEYVSPFICAHRVVEANSKEEAVCQISG